MLLTRRLPKTVENGCHASRSPDTPLKRGANESDYTRPIFEMRPWPALGQICP